MTEPLDAFERVRLHLPKWLSPERQEDLWKELRSFPNNKTIYSTRNEDPDVLQGDGWKGFIAINFYSRAEKTVSGIVLSNSCDLSSSNRRTFEPNVTFAPLASVSAYLALLKSAGKSDSQCTKILTSIRQQRFSSVMYLPGIPDVFGESFAQFDEVRGHPLRDFNGRERSRLFRLSDFGFYLFLFKLSIHFTRMQEDVER